MGIEEFVTPAHSSRSIFSLTVFLQIVLLPGALCQSSDLGTASPAKGSSIFQTSTELVAVPVAVRDRHGSPVHGLTQTDFRVFENGHEVHIRSFEAVATATPGLLPTVSWNSLDADADRVRVRLIENRMGGGLERLTVTDNGHGLDYALAEQAFGSLGGSWKKTAQKR